MPFCDCFGVCEGFEVGFCDGREGEGGAGGGGLGGRRGAGGEGFKVGEVEPVFTTRVRTWKCRDVESTIDMWMSFMERTCADVGGSDWGWRRGRGGRRNGIAKHSARCNVEFEDISGDAGQRDR